MPNSSEILKQLHDQYRAGVVDYRDRMLACGRLVHDYILAYLTEADGMTEHQRRQGGFSRHQALENAAQAVGDTAKQVGRWLRTAMVVQLYGSPLGSLGLESLETFSVFIRRRCNGRRDGGQSQPAMPSRSESWEVRPELAASFTVLLSRAVAEGWNRDACRNEIKKLLAGTASGRASESRVRTPRQQSLIEALHGSLKAASPGDVAEICIELIERAESPADVAIRLRVLLQKYLPKKQMA